MIESDRENFLLLIESLAAAFGVSVEPALLEGYWLGLDDLPIEALASAVRLAIRQSERMPRPRELRSLAGDMPNDARAVQAWGVVSRSVGRFGAYASVNFDDPVINATIRNLGGWPLICTKTVEEFETWLRKDFERIYASLARNGVTEEAARYLVGHHETTNAAAGYRFEPPKEITTGLPAHATSPLRRLSAPERLILSGPVERGISDDGEDDDTESERREAG